MYALILAGGRGERLRPLTDTLPKPMVPLAGKPLLWHQVRWLMEAGVTDVVFLAGYRWEAIQEFFGDGTAFGFRAHYSIEDQPLGTGGAIRKGLSLVPQEEDWVVATNGDIITSESVTLPAGLSRMSCRSRRPAIDDAPAAPGATCRRAPRSRLKRPRLQVCRRVSQVTPLA